MTYTDTYDFPGSKLFTEDFDLIVTAPNEAKPRMFAAYCQKIVTSKNKGEVSLRDAAYAIAGAMMIRELDSPLFEELTELAGELELPEEHVDGNPEDRWVELVALVDEYTKALYT